MVGAFGDYIFLENISEYVRQAKNRLIGAQKFKENHEKIEYDMYGNEVFNLKFLYFCILKRHEWELKRLEESMEFEEGQIDPAPFQLVRKTSVYKVHSLFSLLDLKIAFVTDCGRLIGVVALRDVSYFFKIQLNN